MIVCLFMKIWVDDIIQDLGGRLPKPYLPPLDLSNPLVTKETWSKIWKVYLEEGGQWDYSQVGGGGRDQLWVMSEIRLPDEAQELQVCLNSR